MTLSYHKGKQIITDTIQKCLLQDLRTMFIAKGKKILERPVTSENYSRDFLGVQQLSGM
jgi:hypothetical protein